MLDWRKPAAHWFLSEKLGQLRFPQGCAAARRRCEKELAEKRICRIVAVLPYPSGYGAPGLLRSTFELTLIFDEYSIYFVFLFGKHLGWAQNECDWMSTLAQTKRASVHA